MQANMATLGALIFILLFCQSQYVVSILRSKMAALASASMSTFQPGQRGNRKWRVPPLSCKDKAQSFTCLFCLNPHWLDLSHIDTSTCKWG